MSPVYLDHVPSGTSTRPIVHYAQLHEYDMEFKKFDFGNPDENIEHYGTTTPPAYNFENVQVPVVLMAGDNDYLADVLDVYALSEILPNVQKFEVIDITGFTHFDFAIAIDADKVVYNPIIQRMKGMTTNQKVQWSLGIIHHCGLLVVLRKMMIFARMETKQA